MSRVIKFIKLPFKIKLVFIEAYIILGISRMILWRLRFPKVAVMLGKVNCESEFTNEGIDILQVKRISAAVTTMSKYTFWESKCLVQALAAKLMLRRRKLKATVYLGVAKDDKGSMSAHAWSRCGTIYVTGGDGSSHYTITNRFA